MGAVGRPLALVATLLAACGQTINVIDEDAGGSSSDGSVSDAAGSDGGSSDGSAPNDTDAGPGDGGSDDAGANRTLSWGTMVVPSGNIATCIWGRSDTEVYAGSGGGRVLRYDGNSWALETWRTPTNHGVSSIKGSANNLFVTDLGTLYVHAGGLNATPSSFYASGSGQNGIRDLTVVSDTEAYLVADQANGGAAFYRYNGSTLEPVMSILVAELTGIHAANGVVRMAGTGRVYRFESGTLYEESVDWPAGFTETDIAYYTFYGIDLVGSRWMIAAKEQAILELEGSGPWRRRYEPVRDEPLYAIAGHDTSNGLEAFAVGPSASGAGPILRYDSTNARWISAGRSDNWRLYDIWSPRPGLYFAAGSVGSSFEPVIVRGSY